MKNEKHICPLHNVELVLREAKQGKSKGKKFWGCPTWSKTKCSYTLPYIIKKKEHKIKGKFFKHIKDKNGKISVLKIIGQILMIPIYIIVFVLKMLNEVYKNTRQNRY